MRVFQIYFDVDHKSRLEPEFFPYFNADCNEFMENKVIRDLVLNGHHLGSEYFGVVAYKIREKLGFTKENWRNNKNIVNTSTQEFTVAEFVHQLYDVQPDAMSFQRHKRHDVVSVAQGFHPGFMNIWAEVMRRCGYRWMPKDYENVFYCNYFVAKEHIYERYVREMLVPVMTELLLIPEAFGVCNYPEALPSHLARKFERNHYTFHAFICERLFTYFAHIHQLKCAHY